IGMGTDAYYARYRADAEAAVTELEAAAAEVGIERPLIMWALQGPDLQSSGRVKKLNEIYREVAQAHGDLFTDAGHGVSAAHSSASDTEAERYQWVQFSPCVEVIEGPQCEEQGGIRVARLHRGSATMPPTFRDHVL